MSAAVTAVGLVTGWGEGTGSLPEDARRAAGARGIVPAGRPALGGDRFRRATRECLLGVAAVEALLRASGLARERIRGSATGLVYVTGAAYAASNRAFIEAARGAPGTLHFPYTAPSAVPAEVAIEFGLTGAYAIFIGGATTTLEALRHAVTLLDRDACAQALVLAVETFEECQDLWVRGRWVVRRPLLEAAACALLTPAPADAPSVAEVAEAALPRAHTRAGETLACAPLIALALAAAPTPAPATAPNP